MHFPGYQGGVPGPPDGGANFAAVVPDPGSVGGVVAGSAGGGGSAGSAATAGAGAAATAVGSGAAVGAGKSIAIAGAIGGGYALTEEITDPDTTISADGNIQPVSVNSDQFAMGNPGRYSFDWGDQGTACMITEIQDGGSPSGSEEYVFCQGDGSNRYFDGYVVMSTVPTDGVGGAQFPDNPSGTLEPGQYVDFTYTRCEVSADDQELMCTFTVDTLNGKAGDGFRISGPDLAVEEIQAELTQPPPATRAGALSGRRGWPGPRRR